MTEYTSTVGTKYKKIAIGSGVSFILLAAAYLPGEWDMVLMNILVPMLGAYFLVATGIVIYQHFFGRKPKIRLTAEGFAYEEDGEWTLLPWPLIANMRQDEGTLHGYDDELDFDYIELELANFKVHRVIIEELSEKPEAIYEAAESMWQKHRGGTERIS